MGTSAEVISALAGLYSVATAPGAPDIPPPQQAPKPPQTPKKPDMSAIVSGIKQRTAGHGIGSTYLSGSGGVNPDTLTLSKPTVLGS